MPCSDSAAPSLSLSVLTRAQPKLPWSSGGDRTDNGSLVNPNMNPSTHMHEVVGGVRVTGSAFSVSSANILSVRTPSMPRCRRIPTSPSSLHARRVTLIKISRITGRRTSTSGPVMAVTSASLRWPTSSTKATMPGSPYTTLRRGRMPQSPSNRQACPPPHAPGDGPSSPWLTVHVSRAFACLPVIPRDALRRIWGRTCSSATAASLLPTLAAACILPASTQSGIPTPSPSSLVPEASGPTLSFHCKLMRQIVVANEQSQH